MWKRYVLYNVSVFVGLLLPGLVMVWLHVKYRYTVDIHPSIILLTHLGAFSMIHWFGDPRLKLSRTLKGILPVVYTIISVALGFICVLQFHLAIGGTL